MNYVCLGFLCFKREVNVFWFSKRKKKSHWVLSFKKSHWVLSELTPTPA